jgi:hypothetical protein
MAGETLTDEQIRELIECAKRVERPNVKARREAKHERVTSVPIAQKASTSS